MRIRKFDRYCEYLEECIEKVQKARRDGVILTDMELLDYYFKYSLVTGKTRKGDIGLIASFYAEYLKDIVDFRLSGYTNKQLMAFLRKVCFRGRLHGISRIRVSGKDENGIFYVTVNNCDNHEELNLPVSDIKSFTQVCLCIVTLVATDSLDDGEFKSYAEDYLLTVYKDIYNCVKPKPYIYDGASKSLRAYVARSTKSGEYSNIIQFKVG